MRLKEAGVNSPRWTLHVQNNRAGVLEVTRGMAETRWTSARARTTVGPTGRLDIRKQVKGHLMSLDRSHAKSSFEEARTTDTQAQDWSCSSLSNPGWRLVLPIWAAPTPWVLVEARTALVGKHHFPEGLWDQSCFSRHGACKGEVCVCHHEAARGWFQIMQERRCLWVPAGVLGGVGMQRAAVVPST